MSAAGRNVVDADRQAQHWHGTQTIGASMAAPVDVGALPPILQLTVGPVGDGTGAAATSLADTGRADTGTSHIDTSRADTSHSFALEESLRAFPAPIVRLLPTKNGEGTPAGCSDSGNARLGFEVQFPFPFVLQQLHFRLAPAAEDLSPTESTHSDASTMTTGSASISTLSLRNNADAATIESSAAAFESSAAAFESSDVDATTAAVDGLASSRETASLEDISLSITSRRHDDTTREAELIAAMMDGDEDNAFHSGNPPPLDDGASSSTQPQLIDGCHTTTELNATITELAQDLQQHSLTSHDDGAFDGTTIKNDVSTDSDDSSSDRGTRPSSHSHRPGTTGGRRNTSMNNGNISQADTEHLRTPKSANTLHNPMSANGAHDATTSTPFELSATICMHYNESAADEHRTREEATEQIISTDMIMEYTDPTTGDVSLTFRIDCVGRHLRFFLNLDAHAKKYELVQFTLTGLGCHIAPKSHHLISLLNIATTIEAHHRYDEAVWAFTMCALASAAGHKMVQAVEWLRKAQHYLDYDIDERETDALILEAVKAVVYIQDEKETQALLFIRELGARLLASTGHEHVISQPHWVSANYRSWEEMDAQTSIAEVLAHFKSELVPFYAALLISDLPWRQQMGLECLELIVDQCKSNLGLESAILIFESTLHYFNTSIIIADNDVSMESLKLRALHLIEMLNLECASYDSAAVATLLLPWMLAMIEDRSFEEETRCHLYRCLYIHLEYTTDCNIVFDESLFEFVMVDVADGESELLRVGAEKFLGMLVRWFEDTRSPESIGVLTRYCQRSLYSQLSLFLETLASDEKSPQDASTLYLKHVSITIDWLYRALPRAEVGEQTVERSGSDSIAVAIEPTVQPLFDMLFKLAIEYPSLGNNAAFSAFLWRSIIALYSAAPVRDREQMDIKLAAFIGRCIAHLHVQSLPTHRIAFLRAIVASWERFGSSLREHELALFDAIMMRVDTILDDNIYRLIMLLLWNRREDVTVSTLHSIVMKLLSESCSRTNIHRQTLKLVQIVILRRNGNDAMSLVQMCVDEIRSMVALDETPGSDGVSVVRYSASMLGHRRRELLVFLVELVCSIRQEHISEPSALVAFDRCLGLCGELSLEEIVSLHAIVAALLAKLSNYSDAVMRAVIVLQVMTVRTFRYDEKLTCKLLQQLIGLVRQFGSSFVTQDERFWEQVMQGLSGTRKLLKWTSAAYAFMVIQATGSIPDVVNDRFKTIVDALGRSASRHDSRLSVALRSQHSQATADVTVIDEVLGAIHAGDDTPSNHVGQSLDNDSIERDFCLTEHGSLESANLDFRIKSESVRFGDFFDKPSDTSYLQMLYNKIQISAIVTDFLSKLPAAESDSDDYDIM